MNQLITVSKLEYFLGSTIDDSMAAESIVDESSTPKARIGSGDFKFKGKQKPSQAPKNKDLNSDLSINNESSKASKMGSNKANKTRQRYNSVNPFNHKAATKPRVKSGTGESKVSKNSKIGFGKFSKDISTRATNITNSENDENFSTMGAEGLRLSNEKLKRKANKRGNSVLRKQNKMMKDAPNIKQKSHALKNGNLEEEKIPEDIEGSRDFKYGSCKEVSRKNSPIKQDLGSSPLSPDSIEDHYKTGNLHKEKRTKPKVNAMQRTQNTTDGINFEDSLVTGTKIDIPKKNKNLQK